jgi:aryl-alcohol dehydrogenase-like predicted oxidoreductase
MYEGEGRCEPDVHPNPRFHSTPRPETQGLTMMTTQLRTAQLGETSLEMTRLGSGAWAIGGGGWKFGWGPQGDEESIDAIRRAPGLGINCSRPEVAGRVVVHSLKRDSILREAEASLERLGIDAIDLYQIHWPDPGSDTDEGWSALAELKQERVVHHTGVSNFDVEQLRRIGQIAPVETLQPQYSLIDRDVAREILPLCEREGIGVIVYSHQVDPIPPAAGLELTDEDAAGIEGSAR